MRFRIQDDHRETLRRQDPEPPQTATPMSAVGEEFLAAADEAIASVLSGDAESFLRANKQQGGQ